MPDAQVLITMGVTVGMTLALTLGMLALYAKLYVKVAQGHALIINGMADVRVFFSGGLVIPSVHKAELVDVSKRHIVIDRRGDRALLLGDGARVDLVADVFLRVNKTPEDVVRAAENIGAARLADPDAIESLFLPKLESAVEMVCARAGFDALHRDREAITDRILETIGEDLDGFVVDEVTLRVFDRTLTEGAA